MAVLGGILAVVAWNMSERHRFAARLKMPVADAGVMVATFGLTVLTDLTIAVEVGMILAAALFLGRMANLTRVNIIHPDTDPRYQQHSLEGKVIPPHTLLYSIDEPFFFGAAERFEEILGTIGAEKPRVVIFRVRHVPYLDATGLNALSITVRQLQRSNITVILSAVQVQPLEMMMRSGFTKAVGDDNIQPHIYGALRQARVALGLEPTTPAMPNVASINPTHS